MDDRALATSLAEGHLDGLLAVYDSYADRLFGYGFGLLGSDDAAIGAIRDALLIAHERAGELADPARLGPWLYALTRNECVRRLRHASADDLGSELAGLALRHRLPPADIAVIVGLSADEITHRVRGLIANPPADPVEPEPAAPEALRAQLIDGAAPDAEDYRIALVRRAGPFADSGFPQPLDQRRITGGVLAWSTAAAVLLALALLVVLPGNDAPAGGTTLAALPATVPSTTVSLTSLPEVPFGAGDAWPVPSAATLRPAPQVVPPVDRTSTEAPAPRTTVASRPPAAAGTTAAPTAPDGQRQPADDAMVLAWYQNRTAPACSRTWSARVHAVALGTDSTSVTGMTASWSDQGGSRSIALQRSGRDWTGMASGLPTGRTVTLVVRARTTDGRTLTSKQLPLTYRCS